MKFTSTTSNLAVLTDNHWLEAVMKLRGYISNGLAGWTYVGKPDPKLLAGLLIAFGNPPDYIIEMIAHLLIGGGGLGMPRVKITAPKDPKHFEKLLNTLFEMRRVRADHEKLLNSGHTRKQSVMDLMERECRTPTWVEDAIALTEEAFIKAITTGALPQSLRKRVTKKATRKV